MPVFQLSETLKFPHPSLASNEGLLAIGGDLSQDRLLLAYRYGIFPWFMEDEPIMWWSPDPRLVLFPEELKISRKLKREIRKKTFRVTMDYDFRQTMTACAQIRITRNEPTWIVDDMIDAYCKLHEAGFAHSVEAWHGDTLAGGLYGVSLGQCFFGESMFSRRSNASKVALVTLMRYLKDKSFQMVDCQVTTAHLIRFGAREISREEFLSRLEKALMAPTLRGKWRIPVDEQAIANRKNSKHP